jgi:outer membrane protein
MQATMQAKPRARANLLPQLDATAGYQYFDNSGTSAFGNFRTQDTDADGNNQNWSVNLSQTLLNTDYWRRLKKADKQVAQAEIDYQVAQQDLMIRAAEAYFNVLAAQDTLTAEQANKDAIARQLEQATRRFEVGLIAITDVKEAQAAYDNALALEIAAQRSLAAAKERLREVTGQYPQTLAQPGENLPLIPPEPQVEQDWVDVSLQQNLKLESARIGTEITRDNIKIAESGHLPTLDLSASYGNRQGDDNSRIVTGDIDNDGDIDVANNPNDTDNDQALVGISLNFPIYSGGGVSALVDEEVYRHRASRENYEKVAREAERETRDGYLGVIAEIARVQALARSVESNETAVEATDAGYEVGTRTIVDVLIARQSLFRAKTDYARSKYDYLNNVLKLKRAGGTLQPDDIKQLNAWLVEEKTLQVTPGRGAAPEIQLQPGTPTTGGALKLPGMAEPVPKTPEPQPIESAE